ncbi:hypothetical protein CASFOL_006900 [Castilleja foliolosa]|uniref:SLH domain-containing protein n=1 Tax=Castilleja foliolosa TaxID=1961234 RepID=A0ABD3E9R1_9LAMI
MNALTTTTTFCPSSFQLKLALGGRKPQLAFARARFPDFDRRRVSFASLVVRSSAANGNGLERRSPGNSSWNSTSSSTDVFSGWANADADRHTDDPKPKPSLTGILGVGAAAVVLVAGVTFAVLSTSNKSNSRVKKEMVPMTTQQEKSLSSDDNPNQVEEERIEEKVRILESSSEERKRGTNEDPSSNKENSEAIIEIRNSDDTDVRQSSEDGDSYIPETVERESSTGDKSVSLKAADTPTSDSIQNDNGNIPSENASEPGKLADTKNLEPSVFAANQENIATDSPNGVSSLNEREIPDLSLNPSMLGTWVKSESDAAIVSSITQEEFIHQTKDLLTVDVDPIKLLEISVDEEDKSPVGKNLNGTASNEPLENDYNDISGSQSFVDSTNPGNMFTSAGIPAPSVVSAALQTPPGKVLVPAVVDQLQSQALSALQVLKVIEDDVQPGDLCTRREYARWLVLASSALSRTTTSKVYPAMYIENVSELAFDDITPEDPDFPVIQGLAEAGLIASKLSRRDMQSYSDEEPSPLYFSPGSPLSRQDLVSWKMALEKRQLPVVDRKILQQVSGFIDIDKIDPDAWPALVADLAAGEQGITTLAFGYTRLFQPDKPVTKAQAAIALSTGDASAIVSEELARIEAESMAEKAVTAHNALVALVEKDLNTRYENELLSERERINAVEKMAEKARKEVEKLRTAREEESLSLMKKRAAVDSEMEILSKLRRDVEEQLQTLMSDKLEISYEKERLNKLRRDAETESQEIERLQHELEVERKALSMARSWAEDEAKRARLQAKALDEARDRWNKQGIKVFVDSGLREDEAEATSATWLAAGKQFSVDETIERSETLVDKLKTMANEVSGKCKDTIMKIIEKISILISNLKKTAVELKDAVRDNSSGFTSGVAESARRVTGDWKERVERLSQKFKT